MQIKVFKAATMREAMAAMKAELGEDAVILHSKKYKEGGILGLGSKEIVEISAAVEETSLPQRETDSRPAPAKSAAAVTRYQTDGTAQGIEKAEQAIEKLNSGAGFVHPGVSQSDRLSEKVAEKNAAPESDKPQATPDLYENETPNFDEILNGMTKDDEPVEVESESDADILNSQDDEEFEDIPEQKVVAYNESVEVPSEEEPENEMPEPEIPEKVINGEKISPEEKISQPQQSPEKNSQPAAQTQQPATQPATPPAQPSRPKTQPVTQKQTQPATPQPQTPIQNPGTMMTPEQASQAQAMMLAQFNQMQQTQIMAQVMAQMQAQNQVAEMAEQMRAVHRQRAEAAGKIKPEKNSQPQPKKQPEQKIENEGEKIRKLEEEISQMKALLAEVLGRDTKRGGLSLHEALSRQEVSEEILNEMAAQSGAGDTLADCRSRGARLTLSTYIGEHIKFSDGIKLNRHGVRVAALLGTTGVGKTTTLAKIAAKFVLEYGINAALITTDTYRISAVDQLKTYSEILGLPLEIVYNPAELTAAIERHKNRELILIDTAGRSQQNIHQMRELEEFLRVSARIEKHLVISATTKFTDAKEIMSKFSVVNPEKVIITKIDETGSLGMIMNLLRNEKIAVSYITTGQSVPDDIEPASAEYLTDLFIKKSI